MTPDEHRDGIVDKFIAEFRKKYTKGQAEHGGRMWTKPGMLEHAKEEVLDLVAYLWTLEAQLAKRANVDTTLPAVCYLAGPFRGRNSWEIAQNIRRAEALALEAWQQGVAVICPHANTAHYQDAAPDEMWLYGDLAILARCDVLLLTPDWARSSGATAERDFAIARGMPVVTTIAELKAWKAARG